MRVFDCRNGKNTMSLYENKRSILTMDVRNMSFTADEQFLVGGLRDGTLKIWSMITGEGQKFELGTGKECSHTAFSCDGSILITASADGAIRLWDINLRGDPILQERALLLFQSQINFMTLSSDSKLLAVGGRYNTNVDVWNTDSGDLVEHADIQGGSAVNSIVFAGTEPRLLVVSRANGIKELPLARRRDCEGADDEPQVMGDFTDPPSSNNWLTSVAISPDENHWVLCSDRYGRVCLWSLDGRPQFIMQADKEYGRMPCP